MGDMVGELLALLPQSKKVEVQSPERTKGLSVVLQA